jgi:hypothetical protein
MIRTAPKAADVESITENGGWCWAEVEGGQEMGNGNETSSPLREPGSDQLSASTAAPHPEGMRTTIDLRVGKFVSLNVTARATPAGLAAVALIVAAALIPVVWLTKGRRR